MVKYYRGWQQEGHFFIQMELCEGGNLKDWTDSQTAPLEENRIWDWVRQVKSLLSCCVALVGSSLAQSVVLLWKRTPRSEAAVIISCRYRSKICCL